MSSQRHAIFIVTLLLIFSGCLAAQTTGKIAGLIKDKDSGEALQGANITVEGAYLGASTDEDGAYYILNVPPGTYTVVVEMLGYKTVRIEDVRVSVNRTARVSSELVSSAVEGDEVIVTADRVAVKKDQTSSIRNVSSDQIDILPVQTVAEVIALQPGVVDGHFRGGRKDEVSYLIDGIQVDEAFERRGQSMSVETDAVAEVEVITGIFNAEYGNAMSGVVNAVTKDGGNQSDFSIFANAENYYTSRDDIFTGLDNGDINRSTDVRASVSGPLLRNRLTFFATTRYQEFNGHLNGIRRFNIDDFSDFRIDPNTVSCALENLNPLEPWYYSEATGDGAIVPMNTENAFSFFGKLSLRPVNSMKMSLSYSRNDGEKQRYEHRFRFNPDARYTDHTTADRFAFQFNHAVTKSAFYELKASYVDNRFGRYAYEDLNDSRYIHDRYAQTDGTNFLTGGQEKDYNIRSLKDLSAKLDFIWQLNKEHSIKTGIQFISHELDQLSAGLRNEFFTESFVNDCVYDSINHQVIFPNYRAELLPDSTIFTDIYNVRPYEFAAYLQDKMEFDEMVINLGVRLDYFNPNSVFPSQLRNPANQLDFPDNPERQSSYPNAEAEIQFSPRFGLSYQLGDRALLRFAYGHFFQMPPLYALYQNNNFLVPPNDFGVEMGNTQINAQKTIQYEIGLWQELMDGMSLEVAVFYRDIYDLLSAVVITTYNQIQYGLFSNKDYGNARGLELKYEYIQKEFFASVNYTLQYTRGNADDPTFTFDRAGSSIDPVNRLIPMSWDQRHTLNMTLSYRRQRYGATVTTYYNSGLPYTWSPLPESRLALINLLPNNNHKPSNTRTDLTAFWNLINRNNYNIRLTMLVNNLFDNLNEFGVNSTTGRANQVIIREQDRLNYFSNFSTLEDWINNPGNFGAPRAIKFGIEATF